MDMFFFPLILTMNSITTVASREDASSIERDNLSPNNNETKVNDSQTASLAGPLSNNLYS